MEQLAYQMLDVRQLLANYATVSQNKYGFFLCRKGEADILLNNHSFHIEKGVLCLYTPYTFIRIVRHTEDIEGCLMEGELDTIQPALSNIPATERFAIRSHPCVKLNATQCQRLEQSAEMLKTRTELLKQATKPRSGAAASHVGTGLVTKSLPRSIGNLFQLCAGRRTPPKP